MYAVGSGFTVSTNVDIYVVIYPDWDDGDPILADVTSAVETVSVNNGNVGPVLVWHAWLVPGRYDIIIDANQNSVYNAATDGLDSGSPGFVAVTDAPPNPAGISSSPRPGRNHHFDWSGVVGMIRIRRRFNQPASILYRIHDGAAPGSRRNLSSDPHMPEQHICARSMYLHTTEAQESSHPSFRITPQTCPQAQAFERSRYLYP